jgi:hypothetical protein
MAMRKLSLEEVLLGLDTSKRYQVTDSDGIVYARGPLDEYRVKNGWVEVIIQNTALPVYQISTDEWNGWLIRVNDPCWIEEI